MYYCSWLYFTYQFCCIDWWRQRLYVKRGLFWLQKLVCSNVPSKLRTVGTVSAQKKSALRTHKKF